MSQSKSSAIFGTLFLFSFLLISGVSAVILTEVTPVPSLSNNNIPSYTFNSDSAGTITYLGDCLSSTTSVTMGNNTITFNALSDGLYNNCQINVTDNMANSMTLIVSPFTIDTTAPTIDSVSNIIAEASSSSGASVTITPPMSHDLIDEDVVSSCDKSTGIFPLGIITVTCTKTDAAGNIATPVTFTITIQDTTAPVLSGTPSDIAQIATSMSGNVVAYANPTATDLVDGTDAVICNHNSSETFPIGTTSVSCSATDAQGNNAASNFNVIIYEVTNNSDGTKNASITQDTTFSISNTTVSIPAGTIVTGDLGWDGTINPATIQPTSSVTITPNAGNTVSVDSVIEVGFSGISLTLDHAARILIPGQAGKSAGYSVNGNDFTPITAQCADDDQTNNTNNLLAGADCKMDVGADLVIWTKHFTMFATYTESPTPAAASSGGSGGGGGSCTALWQCTDWGLCSNGVQTRTCKNMFDCYAPNSKPAETQSCGTTNNNAPEAAATTNLGNNNQPAGALGITGAVIGALTSPVGITAVVFVLAVLGSAAFFGLRKRE